MWYIYKDMGRILDELSIQALKALDRGYLDMNDLFDFLMSRTLEGSGHRLSKEGYKAFKRRSWQRRVTLNTENQAIADKKRFTDLIYRLHSHGLITKNQKGMRAMLSITQKGTEKIHVLKKRFERDTKLRPAPGTPTRYKKIKSANPIIVSFDIPEKESPKRVWLRSALHNLDYKILHESVWIGNNLLPEDFLEECRKMNLGKYVHIFSVLKKGTIPD